MKALLLAPVAIVAAAPALAQNKADESAIRGVVERWYEELGKKEKGRVYALMAPGYIDASPHIYYQNTGSAAAGPPVYDSLRATALRFRYDVDGIRADARFAKLRVWERGYFYAWRAQKTYERGASTLFVMEKQDDGRWLILAHQTSTQGIPPNKITDPMPDLKALYYATEGKGRDPAKDEGEAKRGW